MGERRTDGALAGTGETAAPGRERAAGSGAGTPVPGRSDAGALSAAVAPSGSPALADGREEGTIRPTSDGGRGAVRQWVLGLGPLLLLAALVALFVRFDPTGFIREAFPPIEELTLTRVTFPAPGQMEVQVVNGGPEPVTVSQVMVDEAYWEHAIEPDRTIPRLGRATVRVPYPWVQGEPLEVALVTSTGLTFAREVPVATRTPQASARFLTTFTLLGAYAGVIPVLIGLLWYPFLRGTGRKWIHFFLSLTIGLLLFLAVDSLDEALEAAAGVPAAFQGVGLVLLGTLGAFLALRAVAHAGRRRGDGGRTGPEGDGRSASDGDGRASPAGASRAPSESDSGAGRLRLAYGIALGIGLHNLGEGLAIGAAYAMGEIALGSFLVIGFAVHNTTEGFGIVAPVARDRPSLWHLVAMGGLAGVPTIAGAWIGGFGYSPVLGALFLALGAGAILQVVWELARLIDRQSGVRAAVFSPLNAAGLAAGLLIMYGTALLVVA